MKNGSAVKLRHHLQGNLRWNFFYHMYRAPTESWRPHRYFPDDFHILPSSDITITVTSSWYFLRSPCGISSNSWKSIPATIESSYQNYELSNWVVTQKSTFIYKWNDTNIFFKWSNILLEWFSAVSLSLGRIKVKTLIKYVFSNYNIQTNSCRQAETILDLKLSL